PSTPARAPLQRSSHSRGLKMRVSPSPLLKASLSFAELLALALTGACNNGDIPIGSEQDAVKCSTQSDCTTGDVCAVGVCAQACMTDSQCSKGHICLDGGCVSPSACKHSRCGSQCVDLESDA